MREEATISIHVRRGWGDSGIAVTAPIGIYEARTMFAPIDFPSDGAGLASMFCTPNAHQKLKERHELIAAISKHIARELADMLCKGDTEMGYPKDR